MTCVIIKVLFPVLRHKYKMSIKGGTGGCKIVLSRTYVRVRIDIILRYKGSVRKTDAPLNALL